MSWQGTDGTCKVFNQSEFDKGPVYGGAVSIKATSKGTEVSGEQQQWAAILHV
jgi:hypothetical protein